MAGKRIKITSFNCTGFKPRNYDYISDIYNKCDILLIQETWLYNFESYLFNNILPGCQYHAKSSMDESNVTRIGRPFGGLAVVWNKNLALSIIPVETASDRLCAVVIKSDNQSIVLCNVYMPCDNNTDANFEIYGDVLYEMLTLFELYRGYDFIIGGDFNVDFRRNESRNLGLLKQFIDEEMFTCVSLQCPNTEFTYENNRGNKSFIDHFIVSESLTNCNVNVSHDGNNLTEHKPITLETTCSSVIISNENFSQIKIEWDKSTDINISNYKNLQDQYFNQYIIPNDILDCNDFNCKQHNDCILEKLEEFIDIIKFSANATIPNKRFCHKKGLVGWHEFVKPFKEKSIFWHDIWKSAGSPPTGALADLRKFTRSKYRWAVRKAKRDTDKLILNETAQQLANKSFREFWKTMKKLKGTHRISSNVVDGICNDQDISKNFKDIYNDLLNSVEDHNFNQVIDEVNELVTNKCNNGDCSSPQCHEITNDLLIKAVHSLKKDKNDETYYLSSNHLIHASETAISILSKILNAMLKHGIASEIVNKSVIKPIPKNMQKSLSVSTNYRPISKNTIISKLIDYITILQIEDKLSTSSYQFAYKKGFSTSMC